MAMAGAIAGCSGSVEISQDPTCPSAKPNPGETCALAAGSCSYPDGPCTMTFTCPAQGQPWQVKQSTCTPEPITCWAAKEGDVCAIPGDGCGENDGPCGSGFFMQCGADHHWHGGAVGGGSGGPGGNCCEGSGVCPAAIPNDGDACDPCLTGSTCNYGGGCGNTTAACNGVWKVDLGECPPPPPPDACEQHTTDSACDADASCRWLAPGCGMSPIPAAGCFSATNCAGACAPGYACQTVSYNPCYGKKCDACGAEASVCMPAPEP
jgi:hypothetical protein